MTDVLSRALIAVFLLGVFLPFVRVVPGLGSDTQPLALAAGIVIVAASNPGEQPGPVALLFIVALVSALLLLVGQITLPAVRNWSNYLSIFVVAAATWLLGRHKPALLQRALWLAMWMWFAIGFVQTFVSTSFGTQLLSAARQSEHRGVVALAPEPTTYALICLLFMVCAQLLYRDRRRMIVAVACVAQIVLFARSSMGVMLLLLWFGLLLLRDLGTIRGLMGGTLLALVVFAGLQLLIAGKIPGLADSRLQTLATMALLEPRYLFLVDQSGAARLSSIVYALAGFFDGWTIPHGFDAWDAFTGTIAHRFYMIPDVPGGYRPMSGYGSALFELGFMAILVFAAITWAFASFYGKELRRQWPTLVFFHIMLFTAIPLATPTIGFAIGVLASRCGRVSDNRPALDVI
jgi:hypothetical protein